MKYLLLSSFLLLFSCKTPEVKSTKTPEIKSEIIAEQKKVESPIKKEKTIEKIVEKKELTKIVVPKKTAEIIPVHKTEKLPEKLSAPVKKSVPADMTKAIVKKPVIAPKPERLLKLKNVKTLLKYRKSSDTKNYIYASKFSLVEIDGKKLQKIKLSSSNIYVTLASSRKLKSGKIVVHAIITLNKRTAKLEFYVVPSKKSVDFALSSTSLKQF